MSTLQLDYMQAEALKELRSRFSGMLELRHDDRFLLRWLRARNFDVNAAEKMLREDFKYRKKIGSDTILEDYHMSPDLVPFKCDKFLGFDYKGNAVHFYAGGQPDLKGFCRSMTVCETIKEFAHSLESDFKFMRENNLKTGKNAERMVFLVDMTDFQLTTWCDKVVIRHGLSLITFYQNHYPETMDVTYIVNSPRIFWYVFNMFKPFFNEVVLNKIKLFESGDDSWQDEFFSRVPKEIVPAYIGGERYEPDAKCSAFICWSKKIPISCYLHDMNVLKISDPDVRQKFIRERSFFEVERDIEKNNAVLSWEFQTKEHNIKFGLFYKKKKPRNQNGQRSQSSSSQHIDKEREVLVPVESVDCQDFVEKGEYECTMPGTYILHFDNTFSWIRSKHLLYKIEVTTTSSLMNSDQ